MNISRTAKDPSTPTQPPLMFARWRPPRSRPILLLYLLKHWPRVTSVGSGGIREKPCERVIVINHGRIVEDDRLANITRKLAPYKLVHVLTDGTVAPIDIPGCRLRSADGSRMCLEFDHHQHDSVELIGKLSRLMQINDFSIVDPDIEEVIVTYYGAPPADRADGLS